MAQQGLLPGEALALVERAWDEIVTIHAAALAKLAPGENGKAWDVYLDTLTPTFLDDFLPAGFGPTKQAAYRACGKVREAYQAQKLELEGITMRNH